MHGVHEAAGSNPVFPTKFMSPEQEAGLIKNEKSPAKPVRVLVVDDNPVVKKLIGFSGKRIDLDLEIGSFDKFSSSLEDILGNNRNFDLAVLDKSGGVGSRFDEKLYRIILAQHSLSLMHEYPLTDLIIRLIERNPSCKILINSRSSYSDRNQYIPEGLENSISFGDKTGDKIDSWLAKNTGRFDIHYRKLIEEYH